MTSIPILTLTETANGPVTADRFVTPAGAVAGYGAATLGVVTTTDINGAAIPVVVLGVAIVEAGDVVLKKATVMSDALGRAVPWLPNYAKSAIALDAAAAAGQKIRVLLLQNTIPATELAALVIPFDASAAVTKDRFVTTAGAVATAGANTLGVAIENAVLGASFKVAVSGAVLVDAGAAVSAGAVCKSDATGRAITWAVSGAKVAIALMSATAADDKIYVLLVPNV